MRKITKCFPILILLVLTILITLANDMQEKEKYNKFPNYEYAGFIIPENNEAITEEKVDSLFSKAKVSKIVLVKEIYNEETDSIDLFIATDNLVNIFRNSIDMKKIGERKKDSYIATYQSNNILQSDYIPDFLNNDRFAFKKTDSMKNENIYRLGTYTIYYKNIEDYNSFIQNAMDIFDVPKDSLTNEYWGQLNTHTNLVFIFIMVCIAFFVLFYFLAVLFRLYKETKKIGCLILLGFYKKDITIIMIKKVVCVMVLINILCILFCIFMLPNTKVTLLIHLLLADIIIIILTFVLTYFALILIKKYTSISNILKKESILEKLSKLCLYTKCIIVFGIIIFTVALVPLLQSSIDSTKILKNNKILMEYAVFPRINVENNSYDDYDKYLIFFNELNKNKISYIYVNFESYLETDKETVNDFINMEKEGTFYRIASVDFNYLKKYNLHFYNENGNKIELLEENKEIYLLPKSKSAYANALKVRVLDRYKNYDVKQEIEIVYYDDRVFDTYDSVKGILQIESPIFRVINKNYPYTYFENHTGIDVAGTGMNTALKFNISESSNLFETKLAKCISISGLNDVLKKENLVSYKSFYSDELTKLYKTNTVFYGGIIISMAVYIILVMQIISLFIEASMNEILVQLLIGFSRKDIFRNIFYWNIGVCLVPISIIIAFALIRESTNLNLIIMICLYFLIFDSILFLSIIKLLKFNKIYIKLKGE